MDYCAHCKKTPAQAMLCTGCRGVVYCSAACQRAHWGEHKALCRTLKDAAAKGLVKEVLRAAPAGSSPPPRGATVRATYRGTLPSGKLFDESGPDGFEFCVGTGQVIRGWDEAFLQMGVGERARIFIGADWAYGRRGAPPAIPPNYPLVFEVELLSFRN